MAVFFHNGRTLAYQSDFAPFSHDLLLLHGSKFTPDFWQSVLADLQMQPAASGRVVTCEWFEAGRDVDTLARDLCGLVRTLGLHSLRLVACGDAVDLAAAMTRLETDIFVKTLLFSQNVPRGEDLQRAIRDFVKI